VIHPQVIHDPPKSRLDLDVDLGRRTGRERRREIRDERLESRALAEALMGSADELPAEKCGEVLSRAPPHGRLAEQNDARNRKETTVNAPPLDLPIVEHGDGGACLRRRRSLPREDLDSQLRGRPAMRLEADHLTTHHTRSDADFGERIDRHVRDGGYPADGDGR
jgi:hypothetical protein